MQLDNPKTSEILILRCELEKTYFTLVITR
nr:MAG TPA: hypothetical protein [Caudoviricetes sp.]DAW52282.1 MAG TPA: hypothetical protein [Caudoviricetes sp.]